MRYSFDRSINKWSKQCSHCKEVTIGTADEAESLVIFESMFACSGPSSGMADGLQSRCWMCNCSKRRELGATRDIVERIYKEQDGKCEICHMEVSILRNALPAQKANVDHDQATGVIRAILCGPCNRGIGTFFHDPERLRKAANYCEHYNKVVKLMCK